MTRGKHGVSAAARHAVSERDKQIEAYQHNIRKLTAENADLKQKLADQQAAHVRTVQILKAERDEGLSPQVKVLQQRNAELEATHQRWKANWQKAEIAYKCTSDALAEAYRVAGMGVVDARERALNDGIYAIEGGVVVSVEGGTATVDTAGVRHKNSGRVLTENQKAVIRGVQRAKGLRK